MGVVVWASILASGPGSLEDYMSQKAIQAPLLPNCVTIVWNSITTLATFTPMKGKPAAVNVLDKRYIGRLRFLDHTYSLVISNLSMLDRGTYRAQINTEFTTTVTEYLLRVYSEWGKIPVPDILSKPAIAIHSGEGICNVTLTCTTREGGGDIAYSWHQPGKSHVLSTEPILRITQKPADGFLNYTCTVHSAGSKNASMVSLSEHCHGQGQYSHPQLSTFETRVLLPPLGKSRPALPQFPFLPFIYFDRKLLGAEASPLGATITI
uniref:Ig-like domain-containing protein n=1 Tax=Chelydra serpentina TaxID=8475 RepID=A0A8C3TEL2_CHESE